MELPIEVIRRDRPEELLGFGCPICGALYMRAAWAEPATEATTCCQHVCVCGVELGVGRYLCETCFENKRRERDARLFEQALQTTSDACLERPVYWEGHSGSLGEGFFASVDELVSYCTDRAVPVPTYVWACKPALLAVDVDAALELALGPFEGASRAQLADVGELRALVAQWCSKQDLRHWEPNFEEAVVLGGAPPRVEPAELSG